MLYIVLKILSINQIYLYFFNTILRRCGLWPYITSWLLLLTLFLFEIDVPNCLLHGSSKYYATRMSESTLLSMHTILITEPFYAMKMGQEHIVRQKQERLTPK